MKVARRGKLRLMTAVALALAAGLAADARAGPPYFTDDPEPVDLGHYEMYLFSTLDKAHDATAVGAPSFEFNAGVLPDTQFHVVAPFTAMNPVGGAAQYGPGDLELGLKYRFINMEKDDFQVGAFPLIECPTGDSGKGLGNGRLWAKLPVWLQKSWGPWTTYGGGGYAINRGVGQRDFGFGGWLLQREITDNLTLGGEIYGQGPAADGDRGFILYNLGGTLKFTEHMSLLFTAGHTLAGDRHLVSYVGLYWTW